MSINIALGFHVKCSLWAKTKCLKGKPKTLSHTVAKVTVMLTGEQPRPSEGGLDLTTD